MNKREFSRHWWLSNGKYFRRLADGRRLRLLQHEETGFWFGHIECPSGAWMSCPGCKDIAEPASTLEDVAGVPHADISKARDAVAEMQASAARLQNLRDELRQRMEDGK